MTASSDTYNAARAVVEAQGIQLSAEADNMLRLMAASGADALAPAFMAIVLQSAIADHAAALIRSAAASEKHAVGLKWATWALVAATVLLAVVTVAMWIAPAR